MEEEIDIRASWMRFSWCFSSTIIEGTQIGFSEQCNMWFFCLVVGSTLRAPLYLRMAELTLPSKPLDKFPLPEFGRARIQ